jgi:hypothetical protein
MCLSICHNDRSAPVAHLHQCPTSGRAALSFFFRYNCHDGYYFTMIIEGQNKQNIVTFDLNNNATIIENNSVQDYLDSFAFVSL